MSPKKTPPSLNVTDKQLRQALAALREDVAAPADFRAKLVQRLRREGVLQGQPQAAAAQPSLWQRLSAQLTPRRLGFAASFALVLMAVVRFLPRATVQASQAAAPVAVSAAVVPLQGAPASAKPAKLARAKALAPAAPELEIASAPPVKETLPEALLDETAVPKAEGSVGAAAPSAPVTSSQFSSAAPQGQGYAAAAAVPSTGAGAPIAGGGASAASAKPTVVVVEPTATAVIKPLQGNSELRGNVIRASQGQAAVLLYHLAQDGHVHVEIFDRLGRSITVVRDADQSAGTYDLSWSGQADNGFMAASGIYVMVLTTPAYRDQHKLMLVR
jgi:hypothetical protein